MNFGIIGLGNIANKFAKTLNEMNEVLYAVASRNITKANEFKNKYNAVKCYGNYDELLNDPNVDIVYIATPNNMHFINSIDALKKNKNVICEKPFTTNPNDAKILYDYAKENNLFIMEALWIEFLPAYKKIKEIIESKELGNILNIDVSYGFDTNPERKIRKFDSNLAGGALLDIGIYNLAFIDMLLNDYPISFKSNFKLNEFKTDEYSEIEFLYKNNIKAKMITTIGKDLKREANIIFEKGKIYIPDFQQNQSFIVKKENDIEYKFPFKINGFEYQIKEAINSIKNKRNDSLIYSKDKSIRLMKLLYEIRKSWNMKFEFEDELK